MIWPYYHNIQTVYNTKTMNQRGLRRSPSRFSNSILFSCPFRLHLPPIRLPSYLLEWDHDSSLLLHRTFPVAAALLNHRIVVKTCVLCCSVLLFGGISVVVFLFFLLFFLLLLLPLAVGFCSIMYVIFAVLNVRFRAYCV